MDKQIFEIYLKQTQQIAQRLSSDPSALLDILHIIEKHKGLVESNPHDWEEFFKGESTFYSGQYEKSLQHYLAAKEVPYYHFFCFRTSCFVARARGNQEQAINFAKKALKLKPNDELLKQFLHDLHLSSKPKPSEVMPKISLGEKEIAELASIFEEAPRNTNELFSQEFEGNSPSPPSSEEPDEESEQKPKEVAIALELEQPGQPLTTPKDVDMNVGTDIFSSPGSTQNMDQDSLTQRLYSISKNHSMEPGETPLKHLKRLAEEEPLSKTLSRNLNIGNEDIDKRIEAFNDLQAKRLQEYLNYTKKRTAIADNMLFVLNGWDKNLPLELNSPHEANTHGLILTEQTRKSNGGFFLRWNGQGIVINPGEGFLNHFHEQGFSLQDIQVVIVTRDHPSSFADIRAIYDLNNKLNKLGGELQIIHYYLNQKAYQELTSILKPNFKQARNTVHSLELFIDSPDVEKIEIGQGITLQYFLASNQENPYKTHPNKSDENKSATLGIRLELRLPHQNEGIPIRLGYISGTGWSPLLAHHLGVCDLLLTGFGNTSPNDYSKANYQEDCLGYYGTYSLLEEIAPRLLISAEFGGREGDIRLEAIRRLRQEACASGRASLQETTIIPGDIGLYVDLKNIKIECSVTHESILPNDVRIAKSTDSFGRLLYLSPTCYL